MDKLEDWNWHINNTIYKIRRTAVYNRELYSILGNSLLGKESKEKKELAFFNIINIPLSILL